MQTYTARWLLAPARQWQAHRLMAQHGPGLPYPTAWALISLHHHPEDAVYLRPAAHTVPTYTHRDRVPWRGVADQRGVVRRGRGPG